MWGVTFSFLEYIGLSPLPILASIFGVGTPGLKLLVTIFMGYPIAICYNKYVRENNLNSKYLFIILAGLDMAWFNMETDIIHSIIAISFLVLTTAVLGPSKENTILNFAAQLLYLVVGYYFTESEHYDINWTMPHCVLVLRLISIAFDIWDGTKDFDKLSENNKKTAIKEKPELLELLAYCYLPWTLPVGPHIPMKKFRDFTNDKFPNPENDDGCIKYSYERLMLGVMYMVLHLVGSKYFNMEFMLSDDFVNYGIIARHFYAGFWGRFQLYKYLSCWLIAEGACARLGISYNGMEGGQTKWNSCCNIDVYLFEMSTSFGQYIEAFNKNTNFWVSQYVYKRCIFLGNRYLSQLASLLFLAVWHGTQTGYYATFANEFMLMFVEKDLKPILDKSPGFQKLYAKAYVRYIIFAILKVYTLVYMGWSIIPFDCKLTSKWVLVYSRLWFSGYILFVPWPFLYRPIVIKMLKKLTGGRSVVRDIAQTE